MCVEHFWSFAVFLEEERAVEQIFLSWRVVARILVRKKESAMSAGALSKKVACMIVKRWIENVPDNLSDTSSDPPPLVDSSSEDDNHTPSHRRERAPRHMGSIPQRRGQ